MADYWTGLVEGFQGRRAEDDQRNYARAQAEQEQANRVFTYLLQSRDPHMQELALSGMMTPPTKSRGMRGFLGGYESNPFLAKIVARMNEMVPAEGAGAAPGGMSAAMSTNQPVKLGSAAITQPQAIMPPGYEQTDETGAPLPNMAPPPPPPGPVTAEDVLDLEAGGAPPGLGPTGGPTGGPQGMPGMVGPPPESPFKRRGTGVPTAEEVAEMNAKVPLNARIKVAMDQLRAAGATPAEVQHAIMGMLGAPQNQRTLSAVTQWGVKVPGSDQVQPVLLDQTQGYVMAGGKPLPAGATMVRMAGGAGAGGGMTSTIRDSPAVREQYGIDPSDVTPSGYWKIKQLPDGTAQVMPSEFSAPPALSGTVEGLDANGIPVRKGVTRGGGTIDLGDVPTSVKSQTQLDAEGLQAAIDDEVKLKTGSTLGRLKGITPQQRDQIVKTKAQAMGLPYQTYDEVVRAAKSTAPVTKRQQVEGTAPAAGGGSLADRVLQRALQNRTSAPRAPVRPAMPAPPRRAGGAGPNGAR